MRLDKFLKVSRIIKRRTVANEVCDAGKAVVNGKAARASYDVKVGDIVELNFETRSVKFRVEKIAETVRKEDAASMYTPL
jgi:ribosomal 50S subunit-recycling heat shock protein